MIDIQVLVLAMAVAGGLQQDIVTRIVNVQWAGGLAVEFGDKAQDARSPAEN